MIRTMVSSAAKTVSAYLRELPADRRAAISKLRKVIRDNLPEGYEEAMQYGMVSYIIPLSRYPDTYNKQALAMASLASQKQYMSLYLMNLYDTALEAELRAGFEAIGKKPNIGRCCVRFKTLEDIPLDAIGGLIAKVSVEDFIAHYERSREGTAEGRKKAAKKKVATKKKKAPAKKEVATKKKVATKEKSPVKKKTSRK